MADTQDYQEQQRLQQEEQARKNEELRALYRMLLKRDPTGSEYGLDREGNRAEVALRIAGQHQKELATGKQGDNQYQPGLSDPKFRDDLRKLLLGFGAEADAGGQFSQGSLTPDQWRKVSTLEQLQGIPVSFLNPSLTVRREDVDTPEEVSRFLNAHGGDTPLNRNLLKAALDYGGLSIEPTPYGTLSRPGSGLEWTRKSNEPGEMETRITNAHRDGSALSPQELSAIAQERQGSFRLEDPMGVWRQVLKGLSTVPFAIGGGYLGGALAAPILGGALGGGAGTSVGAIGAAPTAGAAGSFIGGSPFAFGVGSGIAGGAGAGIGGSAPSGDPNAIWKAALAGGATGGFGAGLGASGLSSLPGGSAIAGAATGGASNALSQGLGGGGFDWTKFIQAIGTGGAGGAAGSLGNSDFPGAGVLGKTLTGIGGSILGSADHDPLASANQQLDANALKREQDQQAQLQAAQEDWKRRYSAASSEAQAAQLEAFRAAQQEFESKKAEYEAKLQAFLDERQSQIEEALRAMGLAEPGISSLLADRQKQIEAAKAEQQQQEAALVESRNFFPSELLTQTGDQGASSVLVPHSPPPTLYGQEGLPVSFADYSQGPTPTFSNEGFLPSGAVGGMDTPPAVSPMAAQRAPRYFPTLLNGLTRSPYLRYA